MRVVSPAFVLSKDGGSVDKINENIYRLTIPFMDVFTTVYVVKTPEGALLYDTATYDHDVENYILPFLKELDVGEDELKYVFISHNHQDHSGGLEKLMEYFPKAIVISKSENLKQQYSDYSVFTPEEKSAVLGVLESIPIMGHNSDGCGIYDIRTKTLITGDCLQLYGIFGSGKWGANISYIKEHIEVIEKLRKMDVEHILTAHDYHPYGFSYQGKVAIGKALDACIAPLDDIKDLIIKNPELSDEEICNIYNSSGNPTLGAHVVTAVRNNM